ncbi:hypothetical protein V6260_12945, partial [Pseudoalteromonas aliena]|uniref:hypothetical protein n=1 Tax=Pseudoalteromonas aliena TaxID=247523 RepID=UPI00311E9E85
FAWVASRFAWASLTPTGWYGVNCCRMYVGAELAGAKWLAQNGWRKMAGAKKTQFSRVASRFARVVSRFARVLHDSRGQASRFAWASLTPTGWCGVNCYRRGVGAELAGAKIAYEYFSFARW